MCKTGEDPLDIAVWGLGVDHDMLDALLRHAPHRRRHLLHGTGQGHGLHEGVRHLGGHRGEQGRGVGIAHGGDQFLEMCRYRQAGGGESAEVRVLRNQAARNRRTHDILSNVCVGMQAEVDTGDHVDLVVVGDVRGGQGLFAIVELVSDQTSRAALAPWPQTPPQLTTLVRKARGLGVSFAVRGNLIILAPPLVIEERELSNALALLDRLLGEMEAA